MFDEQARDKFTDIPAIRMPKQFAKGVKLFAHQKEGIRWLVNQERSNNESPFVREATMKDGSIRYYCRLTKHRILNPEPLQGSILADGKSFTHTFTRSPQELSREARYSLAQSSSL